MKSINCLSALLLLSLIACKPSTDGPSETEELNPRVWSPLYQMGDNVALGTFQIGNDYSVTFLNSVLHKNASGLEVFPAQTSYGYVPLNAAPGLARNTIAYISRDSLYIAKNDALEFTKNLGSIVDYGIDKVNYKVQESTYFSESILVNDRNDIIIPLQNIFAEKPAYAYFRVTGNPGINSLVSVSDFGIVDIPSVFINNNEKVFDKVAQVNDAFFFIFEKSGLFRAEGNSVLKVLQGKQTIDVFTYGSKIAAALRDSLNNKLFFSSDNGRSFTNSNTFPALDSTITCSQSFYSDGTDIYSFSDCGESGIYNHKLMGTSIVTKKLNENGINNFKPTGFIIENNQLLYASYQGIFTANKDSIFEMVPDTTNN